MLQVRLIRLLLTAAVSLALVSCGEWPPYEEDIRDNLLENREVFVALEAILDENGYGLIEGGGTGTLTVAYEVDGEIEYENLDDDKGWGELLLKAKVMKAWRNDDVFFFPINDSNDGDVYTFF